MEKGKASGAKVFGGSTSRRRLEILLFSGEDAYLWVSQMEQYFHAHPTDDQHKLQAAMAALEGHAFNWYLFWEGLTTTVTWSSFKEAVVWRFQPAAARDPYGVLLNIRQTGTVKEYRELLATLSSSEPLRHTSDVVLRSIFINGLREEVQAELSLYNVDSLSDLMDKAQLIEERKRAVVGFGPRPKKNALMKLLGKIEGRKAVMLVASGGSKSFIAKGVVKELGLPACETDECFGLANGSVVMKIEEVCRGVVVKVQEEMEIIHDFFVLELGEGKDIVSGVEWLAGLGKIVANFRELTMKFEVAGKAVTLKGDPSLSAQHEIGMFERV